MDKARGDAMLSMSYTKHIKTPEKLWTLWLELSDTFDRVNLHSFPDTFSDSTVPFLR